MQYLLPSLNFQIYIEQRHFVCKYFVHILDLFVALWLKYLLRICERICWIHYVDFNPFFMDNFGKCLFQAKKTAFCSISQTNQENTPILKLDFLKIEFKKKKFFGAL